MRTIINVSSFSRSRINQDPVAGSYYGWHSQFARHLVGHLDARIEAWSIDAAVSEPFRDERDGVTYRLFPSSFFIRPGREISLPLLRALKERARVEDVVVHLHDFHNWQSYAIAMRDQVPIVAHFHGATHRPLENLRRAARWIAAPLFLTEAAAERKAERSIRHFFLANTLDRAYYERHSLPYSFCPMAPDVQAFHPIDRTAARQSLSVPIEHSLFLSVGGFASIKNLELALVAFQSVAAHQPSILCLIGPTYQPSYRAFIGRRVRQLGLESSVRCIGMVSRDDLNTYYHAADALLCTSHPGEGGPVVMLEAIAVGTPVIATPVGFARDIARRVPDAIQLVTNTSELISAMMRIVPSHAPRAAVTPWTWRDVIDTVTPVYEACWSKS